MNTPERRALMREENFRARDARKALDHGNPVLALELASQITVFLAVNLITLAAIYIFGRLDAAQKGLALAQFKKQLGRCTDAALLDTVEQWLSSPKRSWGTHQFILLINEHCHTLNPKWDGIWRHKDHTLHASRICSQDPSNIRDPADCLVAAAQTRNWGAWMKRYLELGGDVRDPAYLKLWASKAATVSSEITRSNFIWDKLENFVQYASINEVRRFLRSMTPVEMSRKGKKINDEVAEMALLVYCKTARLEHTVADWVHIAKSALHLRNKLVQKIVLPELEKLVRNEEVETVIARLKHQAV